MLLCLSCNEEFSATDARITNREHPNFGGCPGCGYRGIPADTEKRVQISITWHELRCLTIWAERWADSSAAPEMLKTVYGIAERIQMQHADAPSLTFRGDLTELSETGIKFEQNVLKEPPAQGNS